MDIAAIVNTQRRFFATTSTKNVAWRLRALGRLEAEIRRCTPDIEAALQSDLGKAPFEGYMTEIGLALEDIRHMRRRLRVWAADTPHLTPLAHFPARSFESHEPYGVVLIMSPWNYPFGLTMQPLAGAIAAGNCAVVKPSAYSPATSTVIREICERCFEAGHVAVIEGGRNENAALLEQRFDYIFFTGSTGVGRLVMEKAAKHLTPISLELGGKSPCIVDDSANIRAAGRRIAFGKWLNAGQTCIAPDYVLVQEDKKFALLESIRAATIEFLGPDPLSNAELPKIVNNKHFARLRGLIEGQKIYLGGEDDTVQRIAPTLLVDVDPESAVMQEEIFGPILPVLTYKTLDEAIAFVNAHEKPLALYLFTTRRETEKRVLRECSFGGGCINDTIVHIATTRMGFGGVGYSGMGRYHGKKSFDTFTNSRGILKKSNLVDLPVRYHPYTDIKDRIVRTLLR